MVSPEGLTIAHVANWMTLKEAELAKTPRDGLLIETIYLELEPDGSGRISGHWRKWTEHETPTETGFRRIMADVSPVAEFDSLDELTQIIRQ